MTQDKSSAFGKTGAELLDLYDSHTTNLDLPSLVLSVIPSGYKFNRDTVNDIFFDFARRTQQSFEVDVIDEILQSAYLQLGLDDNEAVS